MVTYVDSDIYGFTKICLYRYLIINNRENGAEKMSTLS